MNLPTKITVLRLFLIPVFVFAYFQEGWSFYIAGFVFILASFTDYLDGYLARKRNETTNLGAFLDPVADKLLVFSALILLSETGIIPSWSVLLIIGRETLINGFRLIAVEKGVVIAASYLGKVKTVTQLFGLIILLFAGSGTIFQTIGLVVYWVAVLATVVSGVEYVYQGRDLLSDEG